MEIMENWKKTVAIVVAIIVFAYLVHDLYSGISTRPDEVSVPIRMVVEEMAKYDSINISEKAYLTNQFVEGRGFGGAGGMGNDVMGDSEARRFMSTIKNESLKDIYYTFEGGSGQDTLIKKYWAPSPKGVFEYKDVYKLSIGASMYDVKSYTANNVVFMKANTFLWFVATILFAIVALIVFAIAYAVLWFMEKVYEIVTGRY